MNTLVAVISAYHPDENLSCLCQDLKEQVTQIVVVNDAETPLKKAVSEELSLIENLKVLWFGKNHGLGKALNEGVKEALKLNPDWIFTFDQDSRFPSDGVERLKLYMAALPPEKASKVGTLCPSYFDPNLSIKYSNTLTNDQLSSVMTSGALIKSQVFEEVGFFDESFMIEYIDHDFFLRLTKNDWLIEQVPNLVLTHELGNMQRQEFMGFEFMTTNHSKDRLYFNARNRSLVYQRNWRSNPTWVSQDLWGFVKQTVKITLGEADKLGKLKAISLGLKDSFKNQN